MVAPQKKPLGKVKSAGVSNCGRPECAGVAVPARDETLHAENAAGSAATAPALNAEWMNLRRVRRKLGWTPSRIVMERQGCKPCNGRFYSGFRLSYILESESALAR